MNTSLCVTYSCDSQKESAHAFAEDQKLPCLPLNHSNTELCLNYGPEYLELKDTGNNTAIHVDFISGALAHRRQYGGGKGQAIARAIGLKQATQAPSIVDATAGLGKDAFVLACLGCPVTMLERSPIVAELVNNAISRACDDENFQPFIETGFQLVQGNAIEYMAQDNQIKPDVVYLDPMYPEKKKSALVKKNMQILQKLLGKDEDTEDLLKAALGFAQKRVVVKRPKGAETIGDIKPSTQIESKKTRYDVYVISAIKNI